MLRRNYILLALVLCIALFFINTLRIYDVVAIFNENEYNNYQKELNTITTNVKKVSDTIFTNTINTPEVIEIFAKAYTSSEEEKNSLREKLYKLLKNRYKTFRSVGIQQLHFHLPNNESFFRFHKPEKFGDDLTLVRESVRYVNENKKPTVGFEEGKIFNGYRFVYPLFDEDSKHIGSVEISSSLLSFKKTFEKVNTAHIDFILHKDTVLKKLFPSELENYLSYYSLDNFYIQKTLNENNKLVCQKNTEYVKTFLKDPDILANLFPIEKQTYFKFIDSKIYTIYLIPLLNDFTKKKVGYSLIIGESEYIKYFYKNIIISYTVFFLISILIAYIFYRNKRFFLEQLDKNKFITESYTDALTQLCNRKYYNQRIYDEIGRFNRYNTTFSIIVCDIDHFKSINDTYGHDIGDMVLKDLGELLRNTFRSTDRICRIGGEEFVIVLPELNLEQTLVLAEGLRHKVQTKLNTIKNKTITISLGVTEVKENDTVESIFKRADTYLYNSKSGGRNQINSDLNET